MAENTSNAKPIEGKVASVLNERELAVNIGREHGVKPGMKFKVLAGTPTVILDPESGQPLGKLDRDKVRVQAVDVQEKFSVCKTYKKRYVGGSPLYDMLSMNILAAAPRQVVETLKAEEASLPPPLSEMESYVKIGDRVIQLMNDDDELPASS